MESSFNGPIIVISPFASNKFSGHSLIDDEFYFESLLNKVGSFTFYTSHYSAEKLKCKFPNAASLICPLEPYTPGGMGHFIFARKPYIPKGSKVIFFGYTEKLILAWLLLNIFKKSKLTLVATNNLTLDRMKRYGGWAMKIFFVLLLKNLEQIVVHSECEALTLSRLIPVISDRCRIKRHHLMIPRASMRSRNLDDSIRISFFGPPKSDKPIKPILDLISEDKFGKFSYDLYSINLQEVLSSGGWDVVPPWVRVHEEWLEYKDYLIKFANSDIVLLSHNRAFESKLSGNLCDCFSLGIPYISSKIEPVVSFQRKYGEIGFLYDYDEENWAKNFIHSITHQEISKRKNRLRNVGLHYSTENVRNDLEIALGL